MASVNNDERPQQRYCIFNSCSYYCGRVWEFISNAADSLCRIIRYVASVLFPCFFSEDSPSQDLHSSSGDSKEGLSGSVSVILDVEETDIVEKKSFFESTEQEFAYFTIAENVFLILRIESKLETFKIWNIEEVRRAYLSEIKAFTSALTFFDPEGTKLTDSTQIYDLAKLALIQLWTNEEGLENGSFFQAINDSLQRYQLLDNQQFLTILKGAQGSGKPKFGNKEWGKLWNEALTLLIRAAAKQPELMAFFVIEAYFRRQYDID